MAVIPVAIAKCLKADIASRRFKRRPIPHRLAQFGPGIARERFLLGLRCSEIAV
jgi:hypothetical protein